MKKLFFLSLLFALLLRAVPAEAQVMQIDNVQTSSPAEWLFYYLIEPLKELPQNGDSLFIVTTTDTVRQWAHSRSDKKMEWYAALST